MFISLALAAVLTIIVLRVLLAFGTKIGLIDIPNSRSSHSNPVPRGAGVAFVLVAVVLAAWLSAGGVLSHASANSVYIAALLVGGVGFYDDLAGASAALRLSVHVIAAVSVVFIYLPPGSGTIAGISAGFVAFVLLAYIWGVNLFNFMDGIDGLAIQEALFICISAIFLLWDSGSEWIAFLLPFSFSLFIVLTINWSPAKAFIGDVGSGFLGALLMTVAISTVVSGEIKFSTWLILWGVFWVDATVTLFTRIVSRQPWHKPHRAHAYQKLARRWSSHAQVTSVCLAVNAVWLFPWALACESEMLNTLACGAVALIPLGAVAIGIGAGLPDNSEMPA